ncbi:hypothetical protein EIP86_003228 [Pleurotus ostreatoroseus]|nr:hypothetical protein EIP86_003228 [Pleurotus ostreatoroseus]
MRTFAVCTTSILSVILWITLASAMPGTMHIDASKSPEGLPKDHTAVAVNPPSGLKAKRVEYEVDAPGSFPGEDTKMLGMKRAHE